MAKKSSIFNRLTKALREEEEESAEDIDRDLEAAVKAIQEREVETVSADDVLGGWGEAGDRVFLMDLAPIYDVLGGRKGRMAETLLETCDHVFSHYVKLGHGRASVEGDRFIMRFLGADEAKGFQQAAVIVNEIGSRILGDRFQTIEVPALVVVADVADITNADGSINMEKMDVVVDSGGIAISMDKPEPGAPDWVQLRWKNPIGKAPNWSGETKSAAKSSGPDWRPMERKPKPKAKLKPKNASDQPRKANGGRGST